MSASSRHSHFSQDEKRVGMQTTVRTKVSFDRLQSSSLGDFVATTQQSPVGKRQSVRRRISRKSVDQILVGIRTCRCQGGAGALKMRERKMREWKMQEWKMQER